MTEYSYSPLDLVSNINYNEGKEVTYQYNKAGELVRMEDWTGSYTGHEYDVVLGKYYAKNRFYNPADKRFMSMDPVKGNVTEPLSLVSYLYVQDNPLRWVDPLGLHLENGGHSNKSKAYVTANGVNIRASYNKSSASLGKLYKGDEVKLLGKTVDGTDGYTWAYISYKASSKTITGWVADQYLQVNGASHSGVPAYVPSAPSSVSKQSNVSQPPVAPNVVPPNNDTPMPEKSYFEQIKCDAISQWNTVKAGQEHWQSLTTGSDSSLLDRAYGLSNWITYGAVDAYLQGNAARYDQMVNDPSIYTVANWVLSGTPDYGKSLVAPDDFGSLSYWERLGLLAAGLKIARVVKTPKAHTTAELQHISSLPENVAQSQAAMANMDRQSISWARYETIYSSSISNPYSDKVMLGKYDGGGTSSYIIQAGSEYTYFNLGSEWDVIKAQYSLTDADMFTLFNEPFLESQMSLGKVFYFSHNPVSDQGMLGKELNFLINHGYTYDPSTMTAYLE